MICRLVSGVDEFFGGMSQFPFVIRYSIAVISTRLFCILVCPIDQSCNLPGTAFRQRLSVGRGTENVFGSQFSLVVAECGE